MSGHRHPGRPTGASAAARWLGALVSRWYLRRRGVAALIAARYRSLRAVVGGLLNELAYRRGWLRAPLLLSANLELTNRCNLRCTFCPTGNGRMERPRGLMDPALFERALAGARPARVRAALPVGRAPAAPAVRRPRPPCARARARARSSRRTVRCSTTAASPCCWTPAWTASPCRVDGDARRTSRCAACRARACSRGFVVCGRRVTRDASATGLDVSMVVAPETESAAAAFGDDLAGVADRGAEDPAAHRGPRRTRCREPWRGGLVVLQDGRVTACCVDHDGDLAVGHVRGRDAARAVQRRADARAAACARDRRPAADLRPLHGVPDRRGGASILRARRGLAADARPRRARSASRRERSLAS